MNQATNLFFGLIDKSCLRTELQHNFLIALKKIFRTKHDRNNGKEKRKVEVERKRSINSVKIFVCGKVFISIRI